MIGCCVWSVRSANSGRSESHPFGLFLQLEGIEHRTARAGRPKSNGFVGRLQRTLLDEHFRIAGRTIWYESVEQTRGDLEKYLHHYDHQRPHRGRMMEGRTPIQIFEAGITEQPEETIPEAA